MGDGMGGGWNGRFWGAPIFGQNPGKYCIFPQKDAKLGRPQNSRSYHHPSHPPLERPLIRGDAAAILRSALRCQAPWDSVAI